MRARCPLRRGGLVRLATHDAGAGATGDFIYFWTLDNSRDDIAGDSFQVANGALVMQLD